MTRAFILVADSLGIGAAPDALVFGDANANTLGHIAQWRVDRGQRLRATHRVHAHPRSNTTPPPMATFSPAEEPWGAT